MSIKFQPVIKWSGSKRSQSEEIVNKFPDIIDTYYEPFIGGGSVMFQLLNSNKKVKRYICSDINEDLISLWNAIKSDTESLCLKYEKLWNELNKDEDIERKKKYYYSIRNSYNSTRKPELFLFLSRTCVNGLIRYNSKNEFNTSLHFSRNGINPKKLREIIYQWSKILNDKNVVFLKQSYEKVYPKSNDFIYLDPPYANTKGMYQGTIDYEYFWDWIRTLECKLALSFDGKLGSKDKTYDVPKDIYKIHNYLYSGISGFKKIRQKQEPVYESLYLNY